jgi:hypothetical protein
MEEIPNFNWSIVRGELRSPRHILVGRDGFRINAATVRHYKLQGAKYVEILRDEAKGVVGLRFYVDAPEDMTSVRRVKSRFSDMGLSVQAKHIAADVLRLCGTAGSAIFESHYDEAFGVYYFYIAKPLPTQAITTNHPPIRPPAAPTTGTKPVPTPVLAPTPTPTPTPKPEAIIPKPEPIPPPIEIRSQAPTWMDAAMLQQLRGALDTPACRRAAVFYLVSHRAQKGLVVALAFDEHYQEPVLRIEWSAPMQSWLCESVMETSVFYNLTAILASG